MKGTSVKRGRPKKQLTVDDFGDTIKEALNGTKETEPETKKLATPTSDTSAFKNKRFHSKDGSTCLVTYSGCKDKPIDIYYKS